MGQTASKARRQTGEPEPTWEIAYLYPNQGTWTEDEYLDLGTNLLIEFSNGRLEFPPMPTTSHQMMVAYLYGLLHSFVTSRDLGSVLFAALPVRLWRRKFREPDVVFMHKDHADRIREKYWKGADLVMEVVSGGKEDRKRDLVDKRREYARAGIPEYWIVDPQEEKCTVLRLAGRRYVAHGTFARGEVASSHLLPGFTVDVAATFGRQVSSAKKGPRKPKRPKT